MSDSQFQIQEMISVGAQEEEIYQNPKKQMKYEKGSNYGKWNSRQKHMYFIFFEFIKDQDCLVKGRKMNMVFKMMSEYVGTRNLLQCRSHHQKMCEKYGNLNSILKKGRKQINEQEFSHLEALTLGSIKQIFENYSEKLKNKDKQTCKKGKNLHSRAGETLSFHQSQIKDEGSLKQEEDSKQHQIKVKSSEFKLVQVQLPKIQSTPTPEMPLYPTFIPGTFPYWPYFPSTTNLLWKQYFPHI